VPLSNFAGWVIVGAVGVGAYLTLVSGASGRRVWPGVALYYAVFGFNLAMTIQIGELLLAAIGATIHVVVALTIWSIHRKPGAALGPESRGFSADERTCVADVGGGVVCHPTKARGRKRYPLVLMLEPLFRCNLACAGCGKIQYPAQILRKHLTVEQCLAAVDECGTPVVSIPGGEPLMYPDIGASSSRWSPVANTSTSAPTPSSSRRSSRRACSRRPKYFSFSVHLDGLRDSTTKRCAVTGSTSRPWRG